MQPYLFPYIGYWQLINTVDTFAILDDVNYFKKGYINRNFMNLNGYSYRFTLELKKASQNKLIKDIEVGNNSDEILKKIEISYKNAPYFDKTYSLLSEIMNNKEKNLAKFLEYSIKKISKYLEIKTKFICTSDIGKNQNLTSQNMIINIAQILKAEKYINLPGGVKIYNKEDFKVNSIELLFIKSELIKYQQFSTTFLEQLSIVDVMMFNNVQDIKNMLCKIKLT